MSSGSSSSRRPEKWHTREMRGHKLPAWALAWSCDGKRLASGSNDTTIRIWQPDRGDYKSSSASLRGHSGRVVSLVWHPFNPERLATVSEDKTLRIWDIRQGKAATTVEVPDSPLNVTWSPDARYIVVGNKFNLLSIVDAESGNVVRSHKELEEANEMQFSRNSQYLAVTSAIGLKIFKFPEMKLHIQLDAHPAACASLDLDPRGRYLVVGSTDSIASLWDTTEWSCVRTFTNAESSALRMVRFSCDGDMLAFATEDKAIEIVSVESGKVLHKIPTVSAPNSVAWSPTRLSLAYLVDDALPPREGVVRVLSAN